MMRQIVIDPVTRLEGHLKVMVAVDAGKVGNNAAWVNNTKGWPSSSIKATRSAG